MRALLWIFLIVGFLADLLAVSWWLPAMQDIATKPAVVIVPQLILAAIFGGLGILTSAVSAAALAIIDTIEARPTPTGTLAPLPAPRHHREPEPERPFPVAPPNPAAAADRTCPNCKQPDALRYGQCQHCGWDRLVNRVVPMR